MRYEKLKELREKNGYTCKEIGKMVGITGAYYCQIENCVRNLSYNLACKIARIYDMKPDDIFYEDHMAKRLK